MSESAVANGNYFCQRRCRLVQLLYIIQLEADGTADGTASSSHYRVLVSMNPLWTIVNGSVAIELPGPTDS